MTMYAISNIVFTCGLDIVSYLRFKLEMLPTFPHSFPMPCRELHDNMLTEIPEGLLATTTELIWL